VFKAVIKFLASEGLKPTCIHKLSVQSVWWRNCECQYS